MIISHKFKYVFIELPLTGSTSISKELCELYDGQKILYKHSNYIEFLKHASTEEKKYFIFSCIRNPLDRSVSHYFKIKSDHKNKFSVLARYKGLNPVKIYFKRRYNFIKSNNASFHDYFRKFHKLPYDDWSLLSHNQFDYIIRFENIRNDFRAVLEKLNIQPIRELPIVNKTSQKEMKFWEYYSEDVIPLAKKNFAVFMNKWNYQFPDTWGNQSVSFWQIIELNIINIIRRFYWLIVSPVVRKK